MAVTLYPTAKTYDTDTGAGTENTLGVNLRKSASGGSVELGTSSDPVRTDPTGTTTQPVSVSGTLSSNLTQVAGSAIAVNIGAASAGTLRVVLASDQPVIPVSDNGGSLTVDGSVLVSNFPATQAVTQSGTWNINNISGTISLPTGAATAALQTQPGVDIGDVTINNASGAAAVNIQDGGNSITVDGTVSISGSVAVTGPLTDAQLRATAVPVSNTNLDVALSTRLADSTFTGRINTLGQKTSANSTPVVLSSDQSSISTIPAIATSAAPTYVEGTQVALSTDLAGALRVSGSFTANDVSDGLTGSPVPSYASFGGASDGTNLRGLRGSTSAPAGSEFGLITRNIPSGTQTISGTVTANQGGTWNINNVSGTVSLPTGAATEATLGTLLTTSAFQARINTLGQKTMANSTPVVLASDQSAIPVSGTITANIGTSGSLALDATLTGGTQKAIVRGGAKGSTVAADVTSTASGANHQTLDVAIYDGSGTQITTFSGTQYAEDTAHISGDILTMAGVVQQTADAALSNDGDRSLLQVDSSGYLKVNVKAGASSGTQYADGDARGSATGTLMMVDDGTNIQSASGDTAGKLNVNATQAGTWNINNVSGTVSLPTGAATETTLTGVLTTSAFQARINTLGQKTMANSTPVVLASDQTVIPVSQSGSWSVTANAGTNLNTSALALDATLTGGTQTTKIVNGANTAAVKAASTAAAATDPALVVAISPNNTVAVTQSGSWSLAANQSVNVAQIAGTTTTTGSGTTSAGTQRVVLATDQTVIPVSDNGGSLTIDSTQLPSALVGGRLDSNIGAWLGSTAPTVGSKTSANSIPVVIASDQATVPVSLAANQSVNLAQVAGTNTVTGGVAGSQGVGGLAAAGAAVSGNPVLVGGSDGTNAQRIATDANGIVYDANLGQAIARGRVSSAYAQSFFGEVTTATTTKTAIGVTAFTEQTAGAQRSVKSTSANDTSAGTGARTIKITYFTLSGATVSGPSTETLTMNGTTAVDTVATNICFVETIEVITVGSTGSNVGTIQLYSTTAGGGSVIASIAATDNVLKRAHHYVASGRTCMIYDFFGNNDAASGNNQRISLEIFDPTLSNAAETQALGVRIDGRSQVVINPYVPLTIVGPKRIRAYIQAQNAASQLTTVDVKYVEI